MVAMLYIAQQKLFLQRHLQRSTVSFMEFNFPLKKTMNFSMQSGQISIKVPKAPWTLGYGNKEIWKSFIFIIIILWQLLNELLKL